MHMGLDFSCCLGMHSLTCLWRRNCHVPGSENNSQRWGNRERMTDSTTGRECQMPHTPGQWEQGVWIPPGTHCRASSLWVFTLICKSVKTHTETLSHFWIALGKKYSLGQGAEGDTRVTRKLEPAQGIINCDTVRPQKHLLILQNPGEQRVFFIPPSSN